jgi:hypothetical protein
VRERSYVLCHEIATLEDEDIAEDPSGPMIPPQKLVAVERALMEALDIPYEAQNWGSRPTGGAATRRARRSGPFA